MKKYLQFIIVILSVMLFSCNADDRDTAGKEDGTVDTYIYTTRYETVSGQIEDSEIAFIQAYDSTYFTAFDGNTVNFIVNTETINKSRTTPMLYHVEDTGALVPIDARINDGIIIDPNIPEEDQYIVGTSVSVLTGEERETNYPKREFDSVLRYDTNSHGEYAMLFSQKTRKTAGWETDRGYVLALYEADGTVRYEIDLMNLSNIDHSLVGENDDIYLTDAGELWYVTSDTLVVLDATGTVTSTTTLPYKNHGFSNEQFVKGVGNQLYYSFYDVSLISVSVK